MSLFSNVKGEIQSSQIPVVSESLTESTSLKFLDSGKMFNVSIDEITQTLPSAITIPEGAIFIFRNTGSDGNNSLTILTSSLDKIYGTIANSSSDSVSNEAVGEGLINTKTTANKGDYIVLECNGFDGYYIIGGVGTWDNLNEVVSTLIQVTGTLQTDGNESLVVVGGGTYVTTLFDTDGGSPTWAATLGDDNSITIDYLDGLGLPSVVRDELDYTHVVRTSDTVITVTFPSVSDYEISEDQEWVQVAPASSNSYGVITASNYITIEAQPVQLVALDFGFDFTTNAYMEDSGGDIVTDGDDVDKTYNILTANNWVQFGGGAVSQPVWDETEKGIYFDGTSGGSLSSPAGTFDQSYNNEFHFFALVKFNGRMPLFSSSSPVNFFEISADTSSARLRVNSGSAYTFGSALIVGTTYLVELIKYAPVSGNSNFEMMLDGVSLGAVNLDDEFLFGTSLFQRGSISPDAGSMAHASLTFSKVKSGSQATAIRSYLNSLIS